MSIAILTRGFVPELRDVCVGKVVNNPAGDSTTNTMSATLVASQGVEGTTIEAFEIEGEC